MNVSMDAAIGRFTDWSAPWRFHDDVLALLPAACDRLVFEDAWREALRYDHWRAASALARGAELAESALRRLFPELSPTSTAAIARAASYQWR